MEYLEVPKTIPAALIGWGSGSTLGSFSEAPTFPSTTSSNSTRHSVRDGSSIAGSGVSEATPAASGGRQQSLLDDSATSPKVTSAKQQFLVTFPGEEDASAAAGAICYAIATSKATAGYLYKGVPPVFALGLAAVALDYRTESNFYSSSSSNVYQQQQQPELTLIHGPCPWAVAVALPSSWQKVLNKELLQLGSPAPGDASATGDPLVTPTGARTFRRMHSLLRSAATATLNHSMLRRGLLQPKTLPEGSPQAVAVIISTPMGVAVARVTPQHVEMAAAVPGCDVVLAVPAVTGAGDQGVTEELSDSGTSDVSQEQQLQQRLGFLYEVVGRVGSVTGSTSIAMTSISSSSGSGTSLAAAAAPAASLSSPGWKPVRHGQIVYTGLKISVKTKGELPAGTQLLIPPVLSPPSTSSGTTATPSVTNVTSDENDTPGVVYTLHQCHPWLAVAAAPLLLLQIWQQPSSVLFALLLAALLLFSWRPQLLMLALKGGARKVTSGSQAGTEAAATAAATAAAGKGGAPAAAAVKAGVGADEFVLVLEGGLVDHQPGPYLQLQVRGPSHEGGMKLTKGSYGVV